MRRLAFDAGGAALGVLVAAGAALRFATLDAQSFWRDEASTVLLLRDSLEGVLRGVSEREATPPLYYALAWLWSQAAGTGEVGLRSLSALLGTLTIPVAFAIGARLGGRSAGLLAAALVALNPFLIWFSQEARPYALLVLLTAIATLWWLRAMTEPDRRAPLAWGAAGALALLAHYFAVFLLIPQAALLLRRAGAGPRAALRGCAVVGVAAVALAPLALAQRDTRVDWVGETPLGDRVLDVPKHWVAGPFGNPANIAVAAGALILACGAALAVVRLRRDEARRSVLLAAVALAGVALPLVTVAAGVDYVLDRYLLASLVPLLAVGAHGLAAFRAGRVAAALLACGLLFFTLTWIVDPEFHREDWREVAHRVASSGDETAVITSPEGDAPLRAYLPTAHDAGEAVRVRAVVYVAPWRFGRPRPATPPPPAPEFVLAERAELPTSTLVRFRATAPKPLTPAALGTHTLAPGDPAILLVGVTQPAGARPRRP